MTEFLRRLRMAWAFTRAYPTSPLPRNYWLPENAQELSNFLVGDTGTKFRWIIRNRVNDTAMRAIMETGDHASYKAGVAFGTRGVVAEMDSLLEIASFGMSDEESQAELENQSLS